MPLRPAITRRPSTEKTTAGSVGASAVPMSRASCQSNPNRACAATASAPAVTNVPTTPTQAIAPAFARNRGQPM